MAGFRIFKRVQDMLDFKALDDDVTLRKEGGVLVGSVGGGGGGVTDADYLVGTANAGLSAEIVVGTSPGGELGGTWASPTVDATHSGSSHAAVQSAAEATAAAALSAHVAASDPHTGYRLESAAIVSADIQDGTIAVGDLAFDPATQAELDAVAAAKANTSHVHAGEDITSGTVADARIASTIARDSEVTSAVAAEATDRATADALLVTKTTQVVAGSALTGGGALSGNVTLDVGVDGSTIEVNADALRVKDGGITVAKLSFDPATQTEFDAHINDTSAAHAASAISADSTTLVGTGTDVQAVFEELDNAIVATETVANAAVPKALFDANTVLAADSDNTPAALTMGASTILARLAAGNIKAATPTELRTLLALTIGTNVEAWDADLDAIAALAPSNDDIIQRKAGAWTNRTIAQIVADIAAAGIPIAKLADPTTGKVIGSAGSAAAAVYPPGYEFDYVQITAPVTTTSSVDAITGNAVTYDGSTRIKIEFYAVTVYSSSASQGQPTVNLYEGATDLGVLQANPYLGTSTAELDVPGYGVRFLTPSAGAHTYKLKLVRAGSSGTVGVAAGAGGTATHVPAFMRITKA